MKSFNFRKKYSKSQKDEHHVRVPQPVQKHAPKNTGWEGGGPGGWGKGEGADPGGYNVR